MVACMGPHQSQTHWDLDLVALTHSRIPETEWGGEGLYERTLKALLQKFLENQLRWDTPVVPAKVGGLLEPRQHSKTSLKKKF